jgi:hypothetical protein
LTHLYLILNTFYFSGVKNDQIKRESQGLTEADEYYAYNDSEDEGMQVIQKREKKSTKVTQARNNFNAIKWRIS